MYSIAKETVAHWRARNASRMGAALAYYAMLSFVPLLLIIVMLVGSLLGHELVQGTLSQYITQFIGSGMASYIEGLIEGAQQVSLGVLGTVISALLIIFGAVGVFGELDRDMDELWDMSNQPKKEKFWTMIIQNLRDKAVAFFMIILLAGLLILSVGGSFITTLLAQVFPDLLMLALQFGFPLLFATILFVFIYRILPSYTLPWRTLFLGAFITALFLLIGNSVITLYLKFFVHTSMFGAAASLVGLLVWVYYSAQVFFLGASFTYVYARRRGFIGASRERVQL